MVAVQRSIIWSPHEGQNQFLVGGSELRLYEWAPETNDSPGKAHYISTIPDINLMMCADWSPDPNCPDLVAVGLSTGRTLLVRLNEHSLTNYRIPDGNKTPTKGGKAIIYGSNTSENESNSSVRQQQQNIQAQQKQYPSLGVKLSRSSNVVSFSNTHPHLLAAGLDKVRNDPCLLVWDVTRSLDSYCNTPTGAQTPTAFSTARTINQQELRAAITNQWRIENGKTIADAYEDRTKFNDIPPVSLGSPGPKEQGPVRQYGSSEAISSCTWSIHAHAPLLMAGMGNKYLRVYDIRADPSSNPIQFATKAVHNVIVDPFNPYRIASHTDDGVIKLWDIRRNNNSILTLTPETKGNLSRILFSNTQPGFLASLTKDASHIDLWDIQETCSLQVAVNSSVVLQQQQKSPLHLGGMHRTSTLSGSSLSNARLSDSSKTGIQQHQQSVLPTLLNETNVDHLSIPVLWKSRKTRYSSKKFASFTFIPPSAITSNNNNAYQSYNQQLPNAHTILTVHTDGKFESVKVQEACQVAWQPTGGMIMTGKKGLLSYLPVSSAEDHSNESRKVSQPKRIEESLQSDFAALDVSSAQEPRPQRLILKTNDKALAEQLDKDISVVMRRRLMQGYSMDSAKNLKIIHDDRKLRELWNWVKIADQISDKLSKVGNVDYSFQGVYGIWIESNNGNNGSGVGPGIGANQNKSNSRMIGGSNRPAAPAAITPRSVSPQLTRHNTSVTLKIKDAASVSTTANAQSVSPTGTNDGYKLPMAETDKPALRYLALSACGFAFDVNGFAKELEALERKGEYDKAAALALFHDNTERAIKALNNAKGRDKKGEQQHKLMSAVLASYQGSNTSSNETWRDICESLSNDMKDRPYLKAIFAYISSNNWYKVLDERDIPLIERMAIALRVLKDDALTSYINRTVDTLIDEGDVEGIVVTGLTPKGIELLGKAIDKTNDVQTASLVMSYVVPGKFRDCRAEDWIESYRLLMDRWQMWHARAKYDIQRGKRMNSSEIAPPQVYVRCNFCAQSVGHHMAAQNARNRDGKRLTVQTNATGGGRITGKQKSSVCPNCRKPLPRCALCLLHMGTPVDQHRESIMANDTHKTDPAGFDLWFTWCQTCRHGGHAVHMFDWFQKHSTCPVSSCTCQCQILDI